jgi:AcrR family transcriptional regulator
MAAARTPRSSPSSRSPQSSRSPRRTEALSRERIVEAAVELLDTAGEGGLTFRALTERLATGPGAIYWHVANKDELLGAATEAVVAAAVALEPARPVGPAQPAGSDQSAGSARPAGSAQPAGSAREAVHTVALGLFDAIDEHPWLAPQLARQLSHNPWGSVTPRLLESVGRPVSALGVPEAGWFTAASVLVHYILGAAGQNAANGRVFGPEGDRAESGLGEGGRGEFLDAVSAEWEGLDSEDYPFTRAVADQIRGHDDREQFLAGIDLILGGIIGLHQPRG